MKKETLSHIFSRMPTLETERLLLRPLRVSDAPDMFDYAKDPDVTRYLLWEPHRHISHTKEYLEYLGKRYHLGLHYEWAVVLKAEDRMIGTCGFVRFDAPHRSGEVGYVLHPRYRGRGLAPEALARVLRFGFSVIGLHRIEARYMVENEASRRVLEKVGMRHEGVHRDAMLVKGQFRDIGICAILDRDFRE